MNRKTLLVILDGWGKAKNKEISAVDKANTPFMDDLYKNYPNANLRTDGLNVGLPEGQMGNSEVGHMNIGAGRILYQELAKINLALVEGKFKNEKVLNDAFDYAKANNKNVHLLGLLSDGGVHAHIDHLKAIVDVVNLKKLDNVYIHAFTDGRDVDPRSGKEFLKEIIDYTHNMKVNLASVIGRYYAMDRDNRWKRVKLAYDLLVKKVGKKVNQDMLLESIENSYKEGVTDEFIKPISLEGSKAISDGDVVLFYNFRTDRGRELTQVLSQRDFKEYQMQSLNLYFVTLTNYDETFKKVNIVYNKENIKDTLGEIISKAGKKQIRIAETEKYPHVTFFFNGGKEEPFTGEERILCPSPKVATYDLKPEMSAYEIRDKIIPEVEKGEADFICLNFANPDMVGHTGDFEAAIKACEVVDQCAKDVVTKAREMNYVSLVIADHGNCEIMLNEDGSVNTAHTINPVPIIVVSDEINKVKDGVLADIAPTILKIMGIKKPKLMSQNSLI